MQLTNAPLMFEAISSTFPWSISAEGSPGVLPAAQFDEQGSETWGIEHSDTNLCSGPSVIPTT